MISEGMLLKAGPFNANGALVNFDFDFTCFSSLHVRVVLTNSAGVESDLVLTSEFSVTLNADQNANPGGTVTTVATYATGNKITVVSNVPVAQGLDLTQGGSFNPDNIETALDKAMLVIGQGAEAIARSVRVPVSSSTTPEQLYDNLMAAESSAASSASAAATSEENAANSAIAADASADIIVDWLYKGAWAASTIYKKNNIVYVSSDGASYIALIDHTSDATAFSTDLGLGRWGKLAEKGSAGTGTGDMLKADNLGGLANYATARANMGLTPGTHVQPYSADIPTVSATQAEMEAGTEAALRSMSPLRVKQAIDALAGGAANVQTFTTSGTWTKPTTGKIALVECWGGGGSGERTGIRTALGGQGGHYVSALIPLGSLGATETVTIGAGGAAKTADGTGNSGGNTTFGAHLTAKGGAGGDMADTDIAAADFVTGFRPDHESNVRVAGASYTGFLRNAGGNGGDGAAATYTGQVSIEGGAGGSGGDGTPLATAGAAPGGGGGGGYGANSGEGAAGQCRVTVW